MIKIRLNFICLCIFLGQAATTLLAQEINKEEVLNGMFKSIPSPYEISSLIKKTGVKFNSEIINAPDNYQKYNDDYKKALNLGIYSSDLGYINIYDTPDTIPPAYLKTILAMSSELKIDQLINFTAITGFAFSKDLNGLLSETSSSFEKINRHFIENDRPELSALLLTGGWLETLYLTCQVARDKPNKLLDNKIAEQKIILEQLLPILSQYSEGKEMAKLVEKMSNLQELFKKIKIKEKIKANNNFTIEKWGKLEVVVYRNEASKTANGIKYNQEDLDQILTASIDIRKSIVE